VGQEAPGQRRAGGGGSQDEEGGKARGTRRGKPGEGFEKRRRCVAHDEAALNDAGLCRMPCHIASHPKYTPPKTRTHPMAMFFFKQGLKAPLVISPMTCARMQWFLFWPSPLLRPKMQACRRCLVPSPPQAQKHPDSPCKNNAPCACREPAQCSSHHDIDCARAHTLLPSALLISVCWRAGAPLLTKPTRRLATPSAICFLITSPPRKSNFSRLCAQGSGAHVMGQVAAWA